MVGRPRILNNPKVVPIVFEYEEYLALREIALKEGKSVSEIIRNLVRDYITTRGIQLVLSPPLGGGEVTPQKLKLQLAYMEFKQLVKTCEMIYAQLLKKRKKDIYYYDQIERLKNTIKKAISLASRIPSPPEKYMQKLFKIMNSIELK